MISIIGAGPSGCYTAELLSRKGEQVTIYEEHKKVGEPIECSGILSNTIVDVLGKKILNQDFVLSKIRNVEVAFPNNKKILFKLDRPDIVVDRALFDIYLKDHAVDAGASLKTNTRFLGISGSSIMLQKGKKRTGEKTDVLIGADGAMSKVYPLLNRKKREYYMGSQAVVKGKFDPGTYQIYLGSICPDFFAWVLPESKSTARIGLAAMESPAILFDKLLKKLEIKKGRIISRQGGPIPVYDPDVKTCGRVNNLPIYIVGDAAGMVKATTGGGIVPGLMAAEELAYSIINKKNYEKMWRKRTGRKLYLDLLLRNALNNFSDRDYNLLGKYLSGEKAGKIISEAGRDKSLSFPMLKLVFAEPRLLRFVAKTL